MIKIFLSGSTGMVGRNMLNSPKSNQYNFFTTNSADLDLRDYNHVLDYLNNIKPDIIVHAAGKVGGIKANMKNPKLFLIDNLKMGTNLLIASKNAKVKKFINLGSSCMYPRDAKNPLKEASILSGKLEPTNEGYALSKIVVQRLSSYINIENKLNYKTLVPCNIYGMFDNFDLETSHLIPAIIKKIDIAITNNEVVEIWGDGNARREFMYAEDLSDFIFYSIENYSNLDELMNIGLGVDHSVNEYYETIGKIMNYNGEFIYNKKMPSGVNQKIVSIAKQKKLGWQPKFSLIDGLTKTIDYYYQNIRK